MIVLLNELTINIINLIFNFEITLINHFLSRELSLRHSIIFMIFGFNSRKSLRLNSKKLYLLNFDTYCQWYRYLNGTVIQLNFKTASLDIPLWIGGYIFMIPFNVYMWIIYKLKVLNQKYIKSYYGTKKKFLIKYQNEKKADSLLRN
ncbi:hypothetical protein H8356DRAFT_1437701 [Neocallimastix lanati (nom. inval.)]|nr:hypothetical protein H8356DRAFT_1437701 [Neocallimastix sp. JGI-2020a]